MNTNNAEEIVLDGEYPIDPIKQWRAGYRAGVEALETVLLRYFDSVEVEIIKEEAARLLEGARHG